MKGYLGDFPTFKRGDWTPKEWALCYIQSYGGIDGNHHKAWVLDQVARILHGTMVIVVEARWSDGSSEIRFKTGRPSSAYLAWVASIKSGEDGPDTYEYNEGIAPWIERTENA
jgi:hypothetical protein